MKKIIKQIAGKEGARPVRSILNPAFEYTPSGSTDLKARFERMKAKDSPIVLVGTSGKRVA